MPRILVVRQFDDFSRILSENGFSVINCPTIATVGLDDLSDLTLKLENIDIYDGFFLTSQTATEIFIEKLVEMKIKPRGVIYVLGKRSFDLLEGANFRAVHFAEANTARAMLEKIALDDLRNKRFLFVRGEKSLRVVPDFLRGIAEVEGTIVYRTEKLAVEFDNLIKFGGESPKRRIVCAVFFSPSGAESFLEQCGTQILHQIVIATIGRTTADFLERRGLKVEFVSPRATAQDFAVELVEYLRKMEPPVITDGHG